MTPGTFVDIARRNAEQLGDSAAFVFLNGSLAETSTISFKRLDLAARRVAASIQRCGAAGDRVVLYFPEGPEFIVALFGCFYAGAIAVPCFPAQSRSQRHLDKLKILLNSASARIVLARDGSNQELRGYLADVCSATDVAVIEVGLEEDGRDYEWVDPGIKDDAPALLQFTSGSVSAPKGVVITHANMIANQKLIKRSFGTSESTVCLSWLPRGHDMGLIGHVIHPQYLGVRSILMAPTTFIGRPSSWLAAISKYRATLSGGPNFGFQLCTDRVTEEDMHEMDLRSWEIAFVGAEPVQNDTLERFASKFEACGFKRSSLFPCYGLAEATLLVTGGRKQPGPSVLEVERAQLARGQVSVNPQWTAQSEPDVTAPERRAIVSVGTIGADPVVVIVDPHSLCACRDGVVGEIWVKGPSVSSGYWCAGEELQETFRGRISGELDAQYLRTGDLGFRHDDQLFVTGRIKDLIIVRGRNFMPVDIEATVQCLDSRLERSAGAAFSIVRDGAELLVLVQELSRSGMRSVDVDDLLGRICDAVSEEHGLSVYEVVLIRRNTLPKTSSGKVRRLRTRELYERAELQVVRSRQSIEPAQIVEQPTAGDGLPSGPRVGGGPVQAEPQVGDALSAIVRECVGVDVPRDASMLLAGVDSVVVARVLARIQTVFGVEVGFEEFYEIPTIANLEKQIAMGLKVRALISGPLLDENDSTRRIVEI